jgi:hypothetical protein
MRSALNAPDVESYSVKCNASLAMDLLGGQAEVERDSNDSLFYYLSNYWKWLGHWSP